MGLAGGASLSELESLSRCSRLAARSAQVWFWVLRRSLWLTTNRPRRNRVLVEGTARHGCTGSSSSPATTLHCDGEVPVEAERCAALLGRCSTEGCAAEARVQFAAVHALIYSSLVTKPPNFIEVGSSRMALLMAREQTCEEALAIYGRGSLFPDVFATPSSGGSIPMFGAGTSPLIRGTGACSMNSSKDSGNSPVTRKDSFT